MDQTAFCSIIFISTDDGSGLEFARRLRAPTCWRWASDWRIARVTYVFNAVASQYAKVQRPLGTVVIGGLISATLLTLMVLPTVYAWVEERAVRRVSAA